MNREKKSLDSKLLDGEPQGTWISVYIDAATNELLDEAKNASRRTKRAESELRLKDHLLSFKTITVEGQRTERTPGE